jgi:hypothetical protein
MAGAGPPSTSVHQAQRDYVDADPNLRLRQALHRHDDVEATAAPRGALVSQRILRTQAGATRSADPRTAIPVVTPRSSSSSPRSSSSSPRRRGPSCDLGPRFRGDDDSGANRQPQPARLFRLRPHRVRQTSQWTRGWRRSRCPGHAPAPSAIKLDLRLAKPQEIRRCGRDRTVDRENRNLECVARRNSIAKHKPVGHVEALDRGRARPPGRPR